MDDLVKRLTERLRRRDQKIEALEAMKCKWAADMAEYQEFRRAFEKVEARLAKADALANAVDSDIPRAIAKALVAYREGSE